MIRRVHGPFRSRRDRDLRIEWLKNFEQIGRLCDCTECGKKAETRRPTALPPQWVKIRGGEEGMVDNQSWWIGAKI